VCKPSLEVSSPTATILALSDAIAADVTTSGLSLGLTVLKRRGSELHLLPLDPRHAEVIVELTTPDERTARVTGVRVRLAQHEDIQWTPLEERFGLFKNETELTGQPSVPPARVVTGRPARAEPQTIRISVDEHGRAFGFVVREHHR